MDSGPECWSNRAGRGSNSDRVSAGWRECEWFVDGKRYSKISERFLAHTLSRCVKVNAWQSDDDK